MADPTFHDSSPDATSPDELAVDPRDIELLAAVLAEVPPVTILRAMSVALLTVAVRLQEADTARNAAGSSAERARVNALAQGYLLRRIAEIDAVLDGLDFETLAADHVQKLHAERDRLLAVFGEGRPS